MSSSRRRHAASLDWAPPNPACAGPACRRPGRASRARDARDRGDGQGIRAPPRIARDARTSATRGRCTRTHTPRESSQGRCTGAARRSHERPIITGPERHDVTPQIPPANRHFRPRRRAVRVSAEHPPRARDSRVSRNGHHPGREARRAADDGEPRIRQLLRHVQCAYGDRFAVPSPNGRDVFYQTYTKATPATTVTPYHLDATRATRSARAARRTRGPMRRPRGTTAG